MLCTRLPIRVTLLVCGDEGLQEPTCTLSLNAHGTLVALGATGTISQRLVIQNPDNCAERDGRVTRLGRCYAGGRGAYRADYGDGADRAADAKFAKAG